MQVQTKIQEDAIDMEDGNVIAQPIRTSTINYVPTEGKTSFDTQVRLCKENRIEQEEDAQATILRRLSKFFEYNKKIEPGNEYFTTKKQANQLSPLIDNEIIIFGCDFKKLKLVRKEYLTSQSVIINPSNFKLIYPDQGTAWRAIETNALDQKALANKRQSQEDPLPRCWIEMRPYTFHNRNIRVFVRYATEDERHVQPIKERWSYMYNKCREIYNSQEEERKARLMLDQIRRKERLERKNVNEEKPLQRHEVQKQLNSAMLYDHYNQINGLEWQRGKNSNPGAHKQDNNRLNSRSRSRSRSKGKTNKQGETIQISSVISQQNVTELNHYIKNLQINEKQRDPSQLNLSVEIVDSKSRSEYEWNGNKTDQSTKYDWSYSEYMKRVEQEQEKSRKKRESKIVVITLDD